MNLGTIFFTQDQSIRLPNGVLWDGARGVGFYPVRRWDQYDDAYFEEYTRRAATPMGRRLTNARLGLVDRWAGATSLVDIGIGSGQFVETRPATWGYDVNPRGIRWLLDRGLWWDPYARSPESVSLWDALEHLHHPEVLLNQVQSHVFVSIPIFDGPDHVLRSRHFKPLEHIWYFTQDGLVRFMDGLGFRLLEENRMETDLGRDGIGTFVFRRLVSP